MKKDIEKAEARKSNLQDLILDGTITPQHYQDMKGNVDKDLILFKSKLSGNVHIKNSPDVGEPDWVL